MKRISTDIPPAQLRADLLSLLDTTSAPWASVFMPIERAWNRSKENRLRLRDLLDRIRAVAMQEGIPEAEVDPMLASALDLFDTPSFWEGEADGLALFLTPNEKAALRLPFAPSLYDELDVRPHVRPLWRHLEPDGRFYVLGLSAGGVELYRASRYRIEEVPLKEGPTTLDEALQYDEHIRSLGFHTGTPQGSSGDATRRSAMFHGQEDAGDKAYVKEGLLRFFRTLDNHVRDVLAQETTPPPLVLAGVEALRGLYRQVNQYPHLFDADVEESVIDATTRTWDAGELHRRSWALVRPHFDEERQNALDRFHAAPEQTAANPGSALLAAVEGRVDTLFVAEDTRIWGLFDADRHSVQVHRHRQAGDTELLNLATIKTLQSDGTVYVADAEDVPDDAPIAALLRY